MTSSSPASMSTGGSDGMRIESLLRNWDGETVVVRHDKATGAWICIAIHSTRLGLAAGGTRMKTYADLSVALHDALKLSEGMTFKYALAGFPRGGGKAVIAVPPDMDQASRPGLLRRYGSLVQSLGGLFVTGPDVGTSPEDMDIIAETGAPYIHARTPEAGGGGDSGLPTALGVYHGIQAVLEYLFGDDSLRGRRVLVQGAGGVGRKLIERLHAEGAHVLFSDVVESIVGWGRDEMGLEFVPPAEVYVKPCDLFSPCAMGGVLNRETIPRLRCRAVVGAANNQLAEPDDAARLRARDILYAPDFCVNIGGAMAIIGVEAMGWSWTDAETQVSRVRDRLRQVLEMAEREQITTEAAARRIAQSRLEAAAG